MLCFNYFSFFGIVFWFLKFNVIFSYHFNCHCDPQCFCVEWFVLPGHRRFRGESAVGMCCRRHLPGFGSSFGSPEGLRVLLEPGQMAFTGLRVGVLSYRETGFKATQKQKRLLETFTGTGGNISGASTLGLTWAHRTGSWMRGWWETTSPSSRGLPSPTADNQITTACLQPFQLSLENGLKTLFCPKLKQQQE